jgi:hypothetical protein
MLRTMLAGIGGYFDLSLWREGVTSSGIVLFVVSMLCNMPAGYFDLSLWHEAMHVCYVVSMHVSYAMSMHGKRGYFDLSLSKSIVCCVYACMLCCAHACMLSCVYACMLFRVFACMLCCLCMYAMLWLCMYGTHMVHTCIYNTPLHYTGEKWTGTICEVQWGDDSGYGDYSTDLYATYIIHTCIYNSFLYR